MLSAALPVSRAKNWEQIQRCHFEAAVHEQSEQAPLVSVPLDPLHGGEGSFFS